MRNGSLIIGILSCQRETERNQAVRSTWLDPKVCAYFLVGRPGEPEAIQGDVLFLDCEDTYEALSQKVFAFLRFCDRFLDYEAIFKCDNDTYVTVGRLLAAEFWRQHDYAGSLCSHHGIDPFHHFGKTSRPIPAHQGPFFGPYAEGGFGYTLSRRAVSAILDFDKSFIDREIYEDKMVGDVLRLSGILPHEVLLGRDGAIPDPRNDWITAHPVGPRGMYQIHRRFHGLRPGAVDL